MQKIIPDLAYPLFGVTQTRAIEYAALAQLPPYTLMQRAGLSVAKLAIAVAPHAKRIWLACGPGNNGGDGLEAALHLHHWGKQPLITWLGNPEQASGDTAAALQRLRQAGIVVNDAPAPDFDLCIDALLGIGTQQREPLGLLADCIRRINTCGRPVLAVDLPSGLDADTGSTTLQHVTATHTLSLLTLKPGLFTGHGRDSAGTVWLDTLGISGNPKADSVLLAKPRETLRLHASHKGTFGDVTVVGGAPGMAGAALLAATAALHAGAGRVFVGLLDTSTPAVDMGRPELMFRRVDSLDFSASAVVCGCGGGAAINPFLPHLLLASIRMVIDADAINSIAKNASLQAALSARSNRLADTVLTPHPLEAARLLGTTAQHVQNNRIAAAQTISEQFSCTVVLKGSGTVIASPGQITAINPTGNAQLATAGTGDVLAGMIGAKLASGLSGFEAACQAVYHHGILADEWPAGLPLTAGELAKGECRGR